MPISARNQLQGKIITIKTDSLMAEITLELAGGQQIISVITQSSVESLNLKVGDEVTAIIKSTEVMIQTS